MRSSVPSRGECARLVEIVRRLDGQQFDAAQFALGDAGQRAGRRELDRGGDAEVAQVCRQRSQRTGSVTCATSRSTSSASVAHGGAVGVRQQRRPRVGDGRARRRRRAARPRPAPCTAVWNAPATCSGRTRAPAGGSAASFVQRVERAGGDDLTGAVAVRRGRARAASMPATTSSGSPPSSADMPVGVERARGGHLGAAARGEGDGVGRRERAGDGGRGELADAVARRRRRSPRRPRSSWLGDEGAERDDQRLRDRGVLDLVGVGGGAEPDAGRGRRARSTRRAGRRRRAAPARARASPASASPGRARRRQSPRQRCTPRKGRSTKTGE